MMMSLLLGSDKTGMVILDVQEKLVPVMGQKERVIENILRLIHLSNLFNCCDAADFNTRLDSEDLADIILTGIESHICVYMTCLSLLEKGYRIHIPQDAVDSRTDENRLVGINLMRDAGAIVTSTETVIYQILKRAGTKEFKEMLKLMR